MKKRTYLVVVLIILVTQLLTALHRQYRIGSHKRFPG